MPYIEFRYIAVAIYIIGGLVSFGFFLSQDTVDDKKIYSPFISFMGAGLWPAIWLISIGMTLGTPKKSESTTEEEEN